MARRRAAVTQDDVKRVIRAAKAAGLTGWEIDVNVQAGSIRLREAPAQSPAQPDISLAVNEDIRL